MSKKQVYPMTKGTLISAIDYKAWIEMSVSDPIGEIVNTPKNEINSKYTSKSLVKKINRKPRNRGV